MGDEKATYYAGVRLLINESQVEEIERWRETNGHVAANMLALSRGEPLPYPMPFQPVVAYRQWPYWMRRLILRLIPYSLWRNLLEDDGFSPDHDEY